MKNNYFFLRSVVMTTLLFITAIAFGAAGDFGAWVFKTGHAGMTCDKLTFTEKSLTLELWLNLDAGTDVDRVVIASTMGDGKTGFALSLRTNSANSNALEVRFFVKTPAESLVPIFIPKEQFVGKWGHLAFVVSEADGKAYAYVNGEPYSSIDAVGGWIGNNTTTALAIGKWYSDPQPFGKIADFRIWKTARTAEQIKANYNKRLSGTEQGLYLYYNFDNFDQTILNVANPGTNNGSLLPAATWTNVHSYEILSQKPVNLAVENNLFTWDGTGDSYEVEILEKGTGNVINTETVLVNSYSLSELGLSTSLEYNLKVRAKKTYFYSDWATTILNAPSAVVNPTENSLVIYTENNSIIVNSDKNRTIDVLSVDGRAIRTVNLNPGKTSIDGLTKGLYIIDKQKIILK